MNKWIPIVLIFSLTVNIAVLGTLLYFSTRMGRRPEPSMFGDPGQRQPPMPERMWPREKRQQMRTQGVQFQSDMAGLRAKTATARQQLMGYLKSYPEKQDSLHIALDKIIHVQAEMEQHSIDHLLQMRSFLSDEEWKQFISNLQDRGRMRNWSQPNKPRKGAKNAEDEPDHRPGFMPE
jgi:hypothetical protein